MHCRNIKPLLPDHANGAVSASEAEAVRSHTEHCPDCAAELARYQGLFAGPLSREARASHVDWSAFGVRLNERLDGEERKTSFLMRPAAAIPAVALLIVGALSVYFFGVPVLGPNSSQSLYSDIERSLGEEVLRTFPFETLDDIVVSTGSDAGLSAVPLNSGMLDSDVVDEIFADALGDSHIAAADSWLASEPDLLSSLTSDEAEQIIIELQSKTFLEH
ncbi:MAG: zf-HC2 domain-containing protein [Bacteroidia bacterium]|nr:zf-HC2 domain-containing protein [Bacteroidia bacterium]